MGDEWKGDKSGVGVGGSINPASTEQIPVRAGTGAPQQQDTGREAALGEGGGDGTKDGQAQEDLAMPRLGTG